MLFDLLRQPLGVAGTVANVIGFLLVVVALKFGPLALVEPLGPCDLIFASLINGYLKKLWDPVIVAGMVACTAGVVGFLAIARPSGGRSTVSLSAALPLLAGLAVLLAAWLAVARWNRRVRPLALALAATLLSGSFQVGSVRPKVEACTAATAGASGHAPDRPSSARSSPTRSAGTGLTT